MTSLNSALRIRPIGPATLLLVLVLSFAPATPLSAYAGIAGPLAGPEASLGPQQTTIAALATCTTQANRWDGEFNWTDAHGSSPGNFEGISAQIVVRPINLCGSVSCFECNFSYAWTMISDYNSRGYVQSGFGLPQLGYACMVHWSQVNLTGGTQPGDWHDVFGSCVAPGEIHQYWQQYGGSGQILSNVDTMTFQVLNNAFQTWTAPFLVQYFGETLYRESDMPGTDSQVTTFSDMQVQNLIGDAWVATPNVMEVKNDYGNPGTAMPPGRWRFLWYSGTSFAIDTMGP